MKNLAQRCAIALTLSIGITLLSGCSQSGEDSASSSKVDSGSQSSAVNSVATEEETFAGYPIETDETISVWCAGQVTTLHSSYTSYEESPFHIGLEEMTGVKVDWQAPTAGTDRSQAFNLMLNSDTLPDVICFTLFEKAPQYIEEKIIRDLTEEMPLYAPNYWALLQENEHFDRSVKTDDGQYYAFGSFRESEWAATYVGPVVRKDWLEEQNLSMPETMDDWDEVLRTFKDAYNAQLSFHKGRLSPGFASGYNAYASLLATIYVDDNQKVQFAMAQPEWKEYMTQLHQWYDEGIIDPDSVTVDDAGMRTKALNEKVGVSCTAISQLSNWVNDAKSSGLDADWVGAPYPVKNEGDIPCIIQGEDTISTYAAAVTTSCPDEKLELVLRWLDYGYTEEGYMYWNYGKEGESYTMVDGVPTYTELVTEDPEGINMALTKYVGTTGTGLAVQAENMVRQKNVPVCIEAVDTWTSKNQLSDHMYPSACSLSTEESTEVSTIYAPISTYAEEMALKFLTGEESLDNFDAFLAKLNSMDLDRYLEIKQESYKRFMVR